MFQHLEHTLESILIEIRDKVCIFFRFGVVGEYNKRLFKTINMNYYNHGRKYANMISSLHKHYFEYCSSVEANIFDKQ